MTGDDTTTTSTQTTSVEWCDTHLRIEGPAVAGLQAGFLDNWADQSDDGFDPSDERLVAEDHVGDTAMSVVRGVTVAVLVPGSHADKRFVQLAGQATYERLLDAGVDMCTYETSMMHAKVITVDGVVATVGSANVNQRSTQYDEATNVIIFNPDVVDVLDAHFRDDLRSSRALDPADWADRGPLQQAAEKTSEVVSGWF